MFPSVEPDEMTRILIISNHRMFGSGLNSLLSQETELEVVGLERDLGPSLDHLDEYDPDVVIFDSTGPPYECLPAVRKILRARPGVKVIALTLYEGAFYVFQALPWSGQQVGDLLAVIKNNPMQ
jgi:two-component system response regulator DegU